MSEPANNDVKSLPDWAREAKGILRAELERRGVTYKKLARLMLDVQIHETERSLANKISRGSFSFVFFLQVMRVLGVSSVSLAPTDAGSSALIPGQPPQLGKNPVSARNG